jgi:hypothetical protein
MLLSPSIFSPEYYYVYHFSAAIYRYHSEHLIKEAITYANMNDLDGRCGQWQWNNTFFISYNIDVATEKVFKFHATVL